MGKGDRTKGQVKWYRHCVRQQNKRGSEGDVRRVIIVEEEDTRQVVLEPENQSDDEKQSTSTDGGQSVLMIGNDEEQSTSAADVVQEDDVDRGSSEAEQGEVLEETEQSGDEETGDDIISVHAESDNDL